jgi:hypothetical protein
MKSYVVDTTSDCWQWIGAMQSSGYGNIKCFGKWKGAHRFSFELYHGPIPPGLMVLHSCDNKRCVNPDHLSAGTNQQNMTEAADRGLMPKGEAHPFFGKPSHLRGIRLKTARPVMVLGKTFGSLNEAERFFRLGNGTVAYWIRTSNPKARDMTRQEYFASVGHE